MDIDKAVKSVMQLKTEAGDYRFVQTSVKVDTPEERREVVARLKEELRGYACQFKSYYSRVEILIGFPKRMASDKVGKVRKNLLGADHDEAIEKMVSSSSLQAEFGTTCLCPVCHNYLPLEAFGRRRIKDNGEHDRAPYCRKCAALYQRWRYHFCKDHNVKRLTPTYGPNEPNNAFRAYVYLQQQEEQQ